MAIQQKLSEVVQMSLDIEQEIPVLDLEFKFVRYRLALDEMKWILKMRELLNHAAKHTTSKREPEKVELPRFYQKGKGGV